MKFIASTAALCALLLAGVRADGPEGAYEKGCPAPIPSACCRAPCDPEPLAFEGLAPCEPVQRDGIVFLGKCNDNRYGLAYSQGVFENCEVNCRKLEDDEYKDGWRVKAVCLSLDVYDRPYCYDAKGHGCKRDVHSDSESDCEHKYLEDKPKNPSFADESVALVGCHRYRVKYEPFLLRGNCIKECPEGYYPACLVVKKLEDDHKKGKACGSCPESMRKSGADVEEPWGSRSLKK